MTGGPRAFLAELKRRKVYQVAAAYLAVGVAISVSAPDLFAVFGLPAVAARFVVLLLIVGFPVALVLAWAYEVRPEEPLGPEKQTPPPPAAAAPLSAAPAPLQELVAPREDPRPSLAVLPFASFSDDAEADYFGLGVMEDILTRLTPVKGIRLVSRTSVMRYKAAEKTAREIARELGVRTVLEGSVRKAGGRVRIVAQLIDGTTDEHLWAETYDRDLEDVFSVQTEIAESIAVALRAELSQEERASIRRIPTENLGAWDLYVRAAQTFQTLGPKELAEAQEYVEEAVRLDPGFAQAWGLLAQVLTLAGLCVNEPPSELFPKIRHAAARALELNPRCGEAHTGMAMLKFFHEWDPSGAEQEYDRALALNPDDTFALSWKAEFLVLTGRPTEALATARQSLALDPYSAFGHQTLGQVLLFSDRLDEACRALESAIGYWPRAPILQQWLGLAYMYRDMPEMALQHFDAAVEYSGRAPFQEAVRAVVLIRLGRHEEARATLEELKARARQRYVDPYCFFVIKTGLDGLDAGAPHLEEMLEVRSFLLPYLLGIPRFRPFHGDPRFRAVLDKVFPGVVQNA